MTTAFSIVLAAYLAVGLSIAVVSYLAFDKVLGARNAQNPETKTFLNEIEKDASTLPGGMVTLFAMLVFLWAPLLLARLFGIRAPKV